MYFLLLILSITITKKRKGHKRESSHFRLSSRKQKKKKVNLTCKGEEQKVKANKSFQKFSNFNIEILRMQKIRIFSSHNQQFVFQSEILASQFDPRAQNVLSLGQCLSQFTLNRRLRIFASYYACQNCSLHASILFQYFYI